MDSRKNYVASNWKEFPGILICAGRILTPSSPGAPSLWKSGGDFAVALLSVFLLLTNDLVGLSSGEARRSRNAGEREVFL